MLDWSHESKDSVGRAQVRLVVDVYSLLICYLVLAFGSYEKMQGEYLHDGAWQICASIAGVLSPSHFARREAQAKNNETKKRRKKATHEGGKS